MPSVFQRISSIGGFGRRNGGNNTAEEVEEENLYKRDLIMIGQWLDDIAAGITDEDPLRVYDQAKGQH